MIPQLPPHLFWNEVLPHLGVQGAMHLQGVCRGARDQVVNNLVLPRKLTVYLKSPDAVVGFADICRRVDLRPVTTVHLKVDIMSYRGGLIVRPLMHVRELTLEITRFSMNMYKFNRLFSDCSIWLPAIKIFSFECVPGLYIQYDEQLPVATWSLDTCKVSLDVNPFDLQLMRSFLGASNALKEFSYSSEEFDAEDAFFEKYGSTLETFTMYGEVVNYDLHFPACGALTKLVMKESPYLQRPIRDELPPNLRDFTLISGGFGRSGGNLIIDTVVVFKMILPDEDLELGRSRRTVFQDVASMLPNVQTLTFEYQEQGSASDKALQALGTLQRLTCLKLVKAKAVSGAFLLKDGSFPRLISLHVINCPDAMADICQMGLMYLAQRATAECVFETGAGDKMVLSAF